MNYEMILKRFRVHAADGAVFYQKLRHYHWHVRGDRFFELHGKFEELYLRWAEIVDDLAEHVVVRGGAAPATMSDMLDLATLREDESVPPAEAMVTRLADDLDTILEAMQRTIAVAEEHGDPVAVNLLEEIRDEQTKVGWMLRAWIDDTARRLVG
ncbi:MAG: Dps family protein [Planctomycetota bacterium]|jgi:starvation-inducible DNA-binding protein